MTRIGILSDTHGLLDKRIFEHFKAVDEIWHAGDIGSFELLQTLREFKPTRAVFGNMDSGDVRYSLSEFYRFRVEDVNVLMTHIGGYPGQYMPEVKYILEDKKPDLYICGHSHILNQIPYIFYSSIIPAIINLVLKQLSLSENSILRLK